MKNTFTALLLVAGLAGFAGCSSTDSGGANANGMNDKQPSMAGQDSGGNPGGQNQDSSNGQGSASNGGGSMDGSNGSAGNTGLGHGTTDAGSASGR